MPHTIWRRARKSGLYLPVTSEEPARRAYQEYGEDAATIRAFYKKHEIRLKDSSGLEAIVRSAEEYSQLADGKVLSSRQIFDAIAVSTVRKSLSTLDNESKAQEYLRKLLRGKISYSDAVASDAKNALWELEVCVIFRQMGFQACLDEPDVIWNDGGTKTGIACKKVYSEKHVQNVLSQAVRQIKQTTLFGFVAINLDENVPPGKTLVVESYQDADAEPQQRNAEFLKRHERHLLKYFNQDRLSGVIAATTCLTKTIGSNGRPGFFLNSAWFVWSHPKLTEAHRTRARKLRAGLARLNDSAN